MIGDMNFARQRTWKWRIQYQRKGDYILNYEKKIQDRYAQWEQELTQREKAIREEEQELELDFDTVLDEEEEEDGEGEGRTTDSPQMGKGNTAQYILITI